VMMARSVVTLGDDGTEGVAGQMTSSRFGRSNRQLWRPNKSKQIRSDVHQILSMYVVSVELASRFGGKKKKQKITITEGTPESSVTVDPGACLTLEEISNCNLLFDQIRRRCIHTTGS
jgi:hypothetical protein